MYFVRDNNLGLRFLYYTITNQKYTKNYNNTTKLKQNEYIQEARSKAKPNHLEVDLQTPDIAYSVKP